MPKRLFIFATNAEAGSTLNTFNAKPTSPCTYRSEAGDILVCGMGVRIELEPYIAQADEVWNLGVAGALHDHLQIGARLCVGRVSRQDVDALALDEGTEALITVDQPVHDLDKRRLLSAFGAVVDMEGYDIAACAQALGKKCRIWKIVSDFASPGGRDLIQKNLAKASEHLAEIAYDTLHESSSYPPVRGH